jgi:DNA repair protein RecN (Recombination protein N)
LVQGEERVSEIARMLGGEKISDTTRAHAREMLHIQTNKPSLQESVSASSKAAAKVKAKA